MLLDTVSKVIDVLGGTNVVAKTVGTTPAAVSQWRSRTMPPYTFLTLQGLLLAKGASAPASLWGMHSLSQNAVDVSDPPFALGGKRQKRR